jgi:hypothetical protein
MAGGTIEKQLTIETGSLIERVSFSKIEANRLTKIGNLVAIEFRGTIKNAASTTFQKILELPQGFYSNSPCALFATVNNTAAMAFTYANVNEADRKNVNISPKYTAGADVTITGTFTTP